MADLLGFFHDQIPTNEDGGETQDSGGHHYGLETGNGGISGNETRIANAKLNGWTVQSATGNSDPGAAIRSQEMSDLIDDLLSEIVRDADPTMLKALASFQDIRQEAEVSAQVDENIVIEEQAEQAMQEERQEEESQSQEQAKEVRAAAEEPVETGDVAGPAVMTIGSAGAASFDSAASFGSAALFVTDNVQVQVIAAESFTDTTALAEQSKAFSGLDSLSSLSSSSGGYQDVSGYDLTVLLTAFSSYDLKVSSYSYSYNSSYWSYSSASLNASYYGGVTDYLKINAYVASSGYQYYNIEVAVGAFYQKTTSYTYTYNSYAIDGTVSQVTVDYNHTTYFPPYFFGPDNYSDLFYYLSPSIGKKYIFKNDSDWAFINATLDSTDTSQTDASDPSSPKFTELYTFGPAELTRTVYDMDIVLYNSDVYYYANVKNTIAISSNRTVDGEGKIWHTILKEPIDPNAAYAQYTVKDFSAYNGHIYAMTTQGLKVTKEMDGLNDANTKEDILQTLTTVTTEGNTDITINASDYNTKIVAMGSKVFFTEDNKLYMSSIEANGSVKRTDVTELGSQEISGTSSGYLYIRNIYADSQYLFVTYYNSSQGYDYNIKKYDISGDDLGSPTTYTKTSFGIADNFYVYDITSQEISNVENIYVASNKGLFISTDNGANWAVKDHNTAGFYDGTYAPYVNRVQVDAANGDIYAGVSGQGIVKSTDNGATWAEVPDIQANYVSYFDVYNGALYYASGASIAKTITGIVHTKAAVSTYFNETILNSSNNWELNTAPSLDFRLNIYPHFEAKMQAELGDDVLAQKTMMLYNPNWYYNFYETDAAAKFTLTPAASADFVLNVNQVNVSALRAATGSMDFNGVVDYLKGIYSFISSQDDAIKLANYQGVDLTLGSQSMSRFPSAGLSIPTQEYTISVDTVVDVYGEIESTTTSTITTSIDQGELLTSLGQQLVDAIAVSVTKATTDAPVFKQYVEDYASWVNARLLATSDFMDYKVPLYSYGYYGVQSGEGTDNRLTLDNFVDEIYRYKSNDGAWVDTYGNAGPYGFNTITSEINRTNPVLGDNWIVWGGTDRLEGGGSLMIQDTGYMSPSGKDFDGGATLTSFILQQTPGHAKLAELLNTEVIKSYTAQALSKADIDAYFTQYYPGWTLTSEISAYSSDLKASYTFSLTQKLSDLYSFYTDYTKVQTITGRIDNSVAGEYQVKTTMISSIKAHEVKESQYFYETETVDSVLRSKLVPTLLSDNTNAYQTYLTDWRLDLDPATTQEGFSSHDVLPANHAMSSWDYKSFGLRTAATKTDGSWSEGSLSSEGLVLVDKDGLDQNVKTDYQINDVSVSGNTIFIASNDGLWIGSRASVDSDGGGWGTFDQYRYSWDSSNEGYGMPSDVKILDVHAIDANNVFFSTLWGSLGFGTRDDSSSPWQWEDFYVRVDNLVNAQGNTQTRYFYGADSIYAQDTSTVYLGTDQGLIKVALSLSNGVPNYYQTGSQVVGPTQGIGKVNDISVLDFGAEKSIYLATEDSGLWISDDSGANWRNYTHNGSLNFEMINDLVVIDKGTVTNTTKIPIPVPTDYTMAKNFFDNSSSSLGWSFRKGFNHDEKIFDTYGADKLNIKKVDMFDETPEKWVGSTTKADKSNVPEASYYKIFLKDDVTYTIDSAFFKNLAGSSAMYDIDNWDSASEMTTNLKTVANKLSTGDSNLMLIDSTGSIVASAEDSYDYSLGRGWQPKISEFSPDVDGYFLLRMGSWNSWAESDYGVRVSKVSGDYSANDGYATTVSTYKNAEVYMGVQGGGVIQHNTYVVGGDGYSFTDLASGLTSKDVGVLYTELDSSSNTEIKAITEGAPLYAYTVFNEQTYGAGPNGEAVFNDLPAAYFHYLFNDDDLSRGSSLNYYAEDNRALLKDIESLSKQDEIFMLVNEHFTFDYFAAEGAKLQNTSHIISGHSKTADVFSKLQEDIDGGSVASPNDLDEVAAKILGELQAEYNDGDSAKDFLADLIEDDAGDDIALKDKFSLYDQDDMPSNNELSDTWVIYGGTSEFVGGGVVAFQDTVYKQTLYEYLTLG